MFNFSFDKRVLSVVIALSPVEPQALKVAPIRDMDEALETFGPLMDGTEPLLTPKPNDVQIVKIRAQQQNMKI